MHPVSRLASSNKYPLRNSSHVSKAIAKVRAKTQHLKNRAVGAASNQDDIADELDVAHRRSVYFSGKIGCFSVVKGNQVGLVSAKGFVM